MKRPVVFKGDLPDETYRELSRAAEVAVDCEMMGLNPWRDRLCLVQIASEDGPCAIVQIDEEVDPSNLRELLEEASITKIFHFARLDLLFLHIRLKIDVDGIYCTKIASRMARTYTDRHGLREVVRDLLGVVMDKTQQSSDWGRSQLTDDQVMYAAYDVKYLFDIKRGLSRIIEREGRSELLQQVLRFLAVQRDLDKNGYGDLFGH